MNEPNVDQKLLSTISKSNIEKVRELLKQQADPNTTHPISKVTALHSAARTGNVEIIKILIEAGADPNQASGANQITPLLAAIYKGHLAAVQALLKANAIPNKTGIYHITPMQAAAAEDKIDIGRALLEHGASLEATDEEWKKKLMISKVL